jgi:DNA-binding transcriptional LysR family regulator
MELRLLHTFVAVADLRHFARAAERCNLSQPAVSHQIRQLEEQVGARLLNRDRRRVSLTVAGDLLLDDARRILAAVDRAQERMRSVTSGAVGRVRLGATETPAFYLLPDLLRQYREAHPRYDMHFEVGTLAGILDRVAANELDMGIIAGRPTLGELQAHRIAPDAFVVIAPPNTAFARKRRLRPTDLRDECWILREEGSDTRRQAESWLRRHRLAPAKMNTFKGSEAVKRAVRAGFGIALVSRLSVDEELKAGRLASLPLPDDLPSREFTLVDHPHKHHGAACQAMIQRLTKGL